MSHRSLPPYRSFARLLGQFDAARIPVLRLTASDPPSERLDPLTSLDAAIRSGNRASLPEPSRLTKQLQVLLGAEEHTQQAFATWHGLISRHSSQELTPRAVCAAAEDAAVALPGLASGAPAWPLIDDLDTGTGPDGAGSEGDVLKGLDDLAEHLRSSGPASLRSSSTDAETASAEQAWEQLAHLNQVLTVELKFQQKPFEWAYEGLAPLLLPEVLRTRRGISLSLALLGSSVGRRLGLCLLPLPVRLTGSGEDQAVIGVPDVGTWLLQHQGLEGEKALYWDPVRGRVMGEQACAEAHPSLKRHAAKAGKQALLAVWTELLRTAVIAHQRKGDSDAVAHCLHQLLALDLADPGWEPILAGMP